MADIISYPLGTPAADTLLVGTQMNVQQLDGGEANLTRNFSVSQVASLINTGFAGGYKVYTAALIQTTTTAPVATILQNTTGGTFTYSYVSSGKYKIEASGIKLPANKVAVFMSSSDGDKNLGGKINQDDIDVEQFSITTSALKDGMAAGTSIEIRIYT
jgi:hypothetical protein|tara:strand:+ start:46 stop:522 length:477 start_codon:yes stop_codon:yes gene_type:complete